MSYSFYQNPPKEMNFSFKLEINFGSGWEDITDYFIDYSNIETPIDDTICGLITRDIQVRLFLPENEIDIKWTKKDLPVRLYLYLGTEEELIFDGLTTAKTTFSNQSVELDIIEKTENSLFENFRTTAYDLVDDWVLDPSLTVDTAFKNDGYFLPVGISDEGGLSQNINYRPKPPELTEEQTVRANVVFNYILSAGIKPGIFTINQMLKAMGVFGGFDKNGVFRIKKRVWLNLKEDWDLREVVYIDGFQNNSLDSNLSFNSIDVVGKKFRHFINLNYAFDNNKTKKTIEIVNKKIGKDENVFLDYSTDFNNVYFTEAANGLTVAKTTLNDEKDSQIISDGVYTADKGRNRSFYFDDTKGVYIQMADSIYNFVQYNTFTLEGWFYVRSDSATNGFMFSTRSSNNRGQSLRVNIANRSLEFINVGIETRESNFNFFNFNEWTHFAIVVDQSRKVIDFYRNGVISSTRTYSTNLVSPNSTVLWFGVSGDQTTANFFNGYLSEFRFHKKALTSKTIGQFYKKIKQRVDVNFNLFAYLPFDTTAEVVNSTNFITTNSLPVFVENVPIDLRDWQENTTILNSFSNNSFNQTIKVNIKNTTNDDLFLKEIEMSTRGMYELISEIKENSKNLAGGDKETKKTLESFYINNEDYAKQLADNLLKVYNNQLGVFSFEVPTQPRLMVGDIIKFKTFFGDKKGVVLEKITSYNTEPFQLKDSLLVKVLDDIEIFVLADNNDVYITDNNNTLIQIT